MSLARALVRRGAAPFRMCRGEAHTARMRVVVTGATGNIGTAVVRALAADSRVESIVGIARRRPASEPAKTVWRAADIVKDELEPLFAGADAVVHLAWRIQPSRRQRELWLTN